LAQEAEQVKLTIVFNYQTLTSDRGNGFKKMLH